MPFRKVYILTGVIYLIVLIIVDLKVYLAAVLGKRGDCLKLEEGTILVIQTLEQGLSCFSGPLIPVCTGIPRGNTTPCPLFFTQQVYDPARRSICVV